MPFAWPDDVNARIQIATFVDLEFSYMGRHLALSRVPCIAAVSALRGLDDAPSWRLLCDGPFSRTESMNQLLQQANILRLRRLLTRDEYFVHRLDDQRVRTAVARLIQRGALGLFERVEASVVVLGSTASPPPRQPDEALPPDRSPATTFGARSPAAIAPARIEKVPEPNQALDQNAQARTLVIAARDGTAFCQECARRAAELAERVAA